jgi:phosphoribosylaminoimidazolecarboxamide formyltransferase/IMP cyclohydrolase
MGSKKIQSALISVYHKDGLDPIVKELDRLGVTIYSTGGTQTFIEGLGVEVTAVEDITQYPSIFGGRVKTLHPKVFGGILHRRDNESDLEEKEKYEIPPIDLVIVDLYPFESTVASGADDAAIIEKIDIGGIALIRGAAKNFKDVVIVPSMDYYGDLLKVLKEKDGETQLQERKLFAARAFDVSSHYDSAIFNYMNQEAGVESFKAGAKEQKALRYGENPHQAGAFFGDFDAFFDQIHGKDISYNNLIDIEAAVQLISEFNDDTAFGILKHNNACGFAMADSVKEAYQRAFDADTTSAFGGILVTNKEVDGDAAGAMNTLFFEIIIAPAYTDEALELLRSKKNRIILIQKQKYSTKQQFRSLLNGIIVQDYDSKTDSESDLKVVTKREPTAIEKEGMIFASKLAKHTKSNTIVLAKGNQLLASGVGQTSRVDALEQAIEKAKKFGFSLEGSVMASDAFFPFPDCVEIANKAGITAVIQPGGSIKDQLSIDYCDENNMAMVTTGFRHFKH